MRTKLPSLVGVAIILAIGIVIGFNLQNKTLSDLASVASAEMTATSATEASSVTPPGKPSRKTPVNRAESSPVKRLPNKDVYFPGTEELKPDEMRVICCGSGMPMPRLKQAAACFLVELGNGDKFIFDMGTGSLERIYSLGIPLDYIDKVFLTHLHMDHMGDLPAFYIYGPQNNRSVPLRVWGPGGGGTRPEWGTKAAMDHMEKTWAWMTGTLAGTIDTSAFSLQVTEYDWSKVNNVIYEENGVVIKSIPAIHFEQSASFILEWNGLRMAFVGDSLPNKWWVEHTQGVDLSIFECFFPPDLAMKKWGFSDQEALNAVTMIHSTAQFFGKMMAMTKPKHAVAYHFQNDADTLPIVMNAVQTVYDGPVDYAQDFMVWNVTKDGVRTRMTVPNPEGYPTPPLQEKKVASGGDRYQTPDSVLAGWPEEFNAVADKIYADFNKENGTNYKFQLKE
jgi:ribonuclease Z